MAAILSRPQYVKGNIVSGVSEFWKNRNLTCLSIPKTLSVQSLKFGNGYVISSHILLGMWLHIHAGIKGKPCQ